jgi:methylmalonyl-CoA carboxyltransferase large subunit
MGRDKDNTLDVLQAIEALRGDVARLGERVAALESSKLEQTAASHTPATQQAVGQPVTDEALIMVISAAVAAYLGVQPRIRQIRLIGGASWAQQGRVTIQASHALPIRHG